MATKIKDSATAREAALKLNTGVEVIEKPGEPSAPKEKTTSERLFPLNITDDGAIINRPIRSSELTGPLPVVATPVSQPQGQTPAVQPPTVPTYVKPEDLVGKMARLKVDGVEQDVPAESLFKTNQLERHLNAQLMSLAQERKQLEDERRNLRTQTPPPAPESKKPEVKKSDEALALEARYQELQNQMATLQETMRPAIQESGIKRVEKMVKDQIGTDDFRTYFEKIRDSALEQIARPEVANDPNARRYFDSDGYYFEKYKEMKLKELVSKPSVPAPNPNVPALVSSQNAPLVVNNNGQPVSLPSFESSGGVPSKVSPDQNWQSTYNALFSKAQTSGLQEDWMAVYRHKVSRRD